MHKKTHLRLVADSDELPPSVHATAMLTAIYSKYNELACSIDDMQSLIFAHADRDASKLLELKLRMAQTIISDAQEGLIQLESKIRTMCGQNRMPRIGKVKPMHSLSWDESRQEYQWRMT